MVTLLPLLPQTYFVISVLQFLDTYRPTYKLIPDYICNKLIAVYIFSWLIYWSISVLKNDSVVQTVIKHVNLTLALKPWRVGPSR